MKSPRKFTRKDRLKVESIWQAHWHRGSVPEHGLPQMWVPVIFDFLSFTGHNIMTPEVEELEMLVVQRGKSKEYLKTLLTVIQTPEDAGVSDRLVYAMSATEDEKLKALRFVLAI